MSKRFIFTEGIGEPFFIREFDSQDAADEYTEIGYSGEVMAMSDREVDMLLREANKMLREAQERVTKLQGRVTALSMMEMLLDEYIDSDGKHDPIPVQYTENRYRRDMYRRES